MLAQEIKKKYLRRKVRKECGVIAIGQDFWWHVHDNEELPEGFTIAIHPRRKIEVNPSDDLVDPIDFMQVQ